MKLAVPEPGLPFQEIPLDRGVTLHHRRSDRFKTEWVRVFFRTPLDARGTERHLYAALLGRGVASLPTRRALTSHLQGLYGAGYGVSAQPMAGRHVLAFRASTVSGRYLPGRPKNLASLLSFLAEAVEGPAVGSDGLPHPEVFEQEQRSLVRELRSRLNDKGAYASDRLHELLFPGHPLSEPDTGSETRILAATGAETLEEGRRVIRSGEVDIFLVANCTASQAERWARRHFPLPPRAPEGRLRLSVPPAHRRPLRGRESMVVEQGKLALGFRLEGWKPNGGGLDASLGNLVFGAGPASKLFRNVREKHSLCYDVRSWFDGFTGTLGVHAGIRPGSGAAALAAIRQELRAMATGKISEAELATARATMLARLRSVPDRQAGLVEFVYLRRLRKRPAASLEHIQKQVERAKGANIADLFRRARLNAVFELEQEVAVESA